MQSAMGASRVVLAREVSQAKEGNEMNDRKHESDCDCDECYWQSQIDYERKCEARQEAYKGLYNLEEW